MKFKKIIMILIAILLLCICLSGCLPGDGVKSETNKAGFFSGVWHGWIAPFSLIYSLFNKEIGIYEIYNNGFLYNLGFYMAIISEFGGLALSRKKNGKK